MNDINIYNDGCETCERTHADLLIYSTVMTSDEITAMIGLTPHEHHNKGDARQSVTGHLITYDKSAWIYSTENLVDSKDLRRHVNYILEKFSNGRDEKLKKIIAESLVQASVCGVWWSAHGHGGPTLTWQQMQSLAHLNLDFWLDVYFAEETMS